VQVEREVTAGDQGTPAAGGHGGRSNSPGDYPADEESRTGSPGSLVRKAPRAT